MPNFTFSNSVRNSNGTLNLLAAQASQTIDYSDKADEKIVLIVQNNNDSVAVNTATVTIESGDFLGNALGDLTVNVADGGAGVVIGPLESVRFKNSASTVTVNVAVTQSGTVSSVKLAAVKLP